MRGDAGFSRAHLGLSIVGETFQSSRLPWHWLLSSWEQPAFIGCGVSGKLTPACSPLRPRFLAKAAVSPSFTSAISERLWSSVRVEPQDCFTAALPEDEQDNLVLFGPRDVGTSFGLFKAAQRLLERSVQTNKPTPAAQTLLLNDPAGCSHLPKAALGNSQSACLAVC